jgi:hypothetical protein
MIELWTLIKMNDQIRFNRIDYHQKLITEINYNKCLKMIFNHNFKHYNNWITICVYLSESIEYQIWKNCCL